MKKIYLLAGMAALMLASCSTEEQSTGGYVAGSKITLNALLPNSGTRVTETADATYGLITNWSADDSLDVMINGYTIVSMTKDAGNTFTFTPATSTSTVAAGFNSGKTIYGVNNNSKDNITTDHGSNYSNVNQLQATVNFAGQNGTVENLKKYDLMYGTGDPTRNITFNHKICVLRLNINSDQLKADGITTITGLGLKYVASSGTKLFATREVYKFGTACDSTITDADVLYLNNTNIPVVNGTATVYVAVPHRQNLYGTLTISMKVTDGTTNLPKIYTLTNAISMSNARMLNSTVHPQAVTGLTQKITPVAIGTYLFSDGTCGTVEDSISANPVAVIFSTTTSTTDQSSGWTHGYAIALKNAATGLTWGLTSATPTGKLLTTSSSPSISGDKDGYTNTQNILKITTKCSTEYPAVNAANTYTVAAPRNTSGWYLPSSGQWYDICVNLGGCNSYYSSNGSNIGWATGTGSNCSTKINTYLTPIVSVAYDAFSYGSNDANSYWSSSENSATSAYALKMTSDMGISGSNKNSTSYPYTVRPVIAF